MITEYQQKYYAYELTKRCPSDSMEKLAGALVDAQVDLNPHQVEAALFAFRSPLSKGAVLADEVGLGKTIEAGLLLSQKWAERKRRTLIVTPANLRKQWYSDSHDHILVCAKVKSSWSRNLLPRTAKTNSSYKAPCKDKNTSLACLWLRLPRCAKSYIQRVCAPWRALNTKPYPAQFWYFNLFRVPKNPDDDPRGIWTSSDLSARNFYSLGTYSVTGPTGRVISGAPHGRYWTISKEKSLGLDSDNRIWWGAKGNNQPRLKRFLSEVRGGVVPQTVWLHDEVGRTQEAKKEVMNVVPRDSNIFDTPKPDLTKIPKAVMARCEWAHDDYSLRVESLPQAPREPEQANLPLAEEN